MGVRDYHCYLCGEPVSYTCQSSEQACPGDCDTEGLGEDRAFLDFYRFPRDGAPQTAKEFLSNRNKALSRERRELRYDWGSWEFVPSLDYYGYQDASEDKDRSVWRLNNLARNGEDPQSLGNYPPENAVEFERDPDTTVWVINHCPTCYQAFLSDEPPSEFCRVYLQAVADKQEIELNPSRSSASAYERLQKALKARYL